MKTQNAVLPAAILQVDKANDVAVLRCEGSFPPLALTESKNVKLGQSVFTIGFPQIDLQGFSPKFTKGEISSMSGMRDDPRHWQISAPIQPGNSGGPLLDEYGNVVGIVVSTLNAVAVATHTGSLPQNVNYALKSAYIRPLLEECGAPVDSVKRNAVIPKDVVGQTQKSVVMILVYGKN